MAGRGGRRGEEGLEGLELLCALGAVPSLRGRGPGSVPEPQGMVVAPGDMAQLTCQGWDGQSGAFPPPVEMGAAVSTNPPDPALGSSLTSGRKN